MPKFWGTLSKHRLPNPPLRLLWYISLVNCTLPKTICRYQYLLDASPVHIVHFRLDQYYFPRLQMFKEFLLLQKKNAPQILLWRFPLLIVILQLECTLR